MLPGAQDIRSWPEHVTSAYHGTTPKEIRPVNCSTQYLPSLIESTIWLSIELTQAVDQATQVMTGCPKPLASATKVAFAIWFTILCSSSL